MIRRVSIELWYANTALQERTDSPRSVHESAFMFVPAISRRRRIENRFSKPDPSDSTGLYTCHTN